MLHVTALCIYPIKSCRGIAVSGARVQARGLQFDRRFMLVDDNGRFLTQRQLPRMALLHTAIDADQLHVSGPGARPLTVPLEPDWPESVPVRVWRSELEATLAGAGVNRWFSDCLGRSVRLVYMADHQHRSVASNRATRPADEVSFADGAPILLTSEGSLADLNARLAAPVPMSRFRPNVVVNSTQAFAEDTWKRVRIGGVELEVAWSCARCTMITVDPATGEVDDSGEPLATLREYRREGAGVFFGQNLLTRATGVIRLGDALEVLD